MALHHTRPAGARPAARMAKGQCTSSDDLAFDGSYMHCGQAMTPAGVDLLSISAVYTGKNLPEELRVYLATRVLRCACGFQMEVPDQSRDHGPPRGQGKPA
ncbi:hypothetical protein [Pseudarthrobacter sp. NamB4]|uniref:hypothetical protein n=1 Tax=Pseudarthrobacter sp. NamB4 TaxID=2576837 RepID=UPI0010FD92B3|nr:hypothetical protein [Pseudarthrobacter sp. NamB4]TLM72916.1 hypothetical protein FDW81_11190 [Pseudarthrobacter sp. NamB4]